MPLASHFSTRSRYFATEPPANIWYAHSAHSATLSKYCHASSGIKEGNKKELRLNLAGRPGGVGSIAPRITSIPAPWLSM